MEVICMFLVFDYGYLVCGVIFGTVMVEFIVLRTRYENFFSDVDECEVFLDVLCCGESDGWGGVMKLLFVGLCSYKL